MYLVASVWGTFELSVMITVTRVEISKDDDLSPETDSDTMDVDTVSHDGDDKHGPRVMKNGKSGGPMAKGGGFIVPEPILEFAVSEI